jgi:hypothetical protein
MTMEKGKRKAAPRPAGVRLLKGFWRYGVVAPGSFAAATGRWAGRSAWRSGVWAARQGWRGVRGAWGLTRWALWQPLRLLGWLFGYGALPAFENVYQQEAYLRVKRRYRRHWWRNLHAIAWLTFTLGLALQLLIQWAQLGGSAVQRYFLTNQIYSGLFVVGMWALVLLVHGFYVRTRDREDEALADALERYRDYTPREKRKGLRYEEVLESYAPHDETAYDRLADDTDTAPEQDWAQVMTAQERVRARKRRG